MEPVLVNTNITEENSRFVQNRLPTQGAAKEVVVDETPVFRVAVR